MRRFIYRAIFFIFVVVSVILLSACKEDGGNHVFEDWTVIKESTCSEKGLRVRTCTICGEEETEEMSIVSHKYDSKHECVWCGGQEATDNLKYSLSEDGKSYIVSGYNGNKKDITIPSEHNGLPVSGIAKEAFYGNNKITTLYIHSSMTKIDEKAFWGCLSLVSVTLPDSISEIGEGAFDGCTKLVEVVNHSSLNIEKGSELNGKIAKNAVFVHSDSESRIKSTKEGYLYFVDGDINLVAYVGEEKKIILPEAIENKKYIVYINAFAYSGITELEITSGAKAVGDKAFTYCSQLESVFISSPSTTYGDMVFSNCIFLKEVRFSELVAELGTSMFRNCTSLEEVSLPKGLEKVSANLFYACTALKSVAFNSSVEEIGEYTFFGCTSLKYVALSEGMKKIGIYAFSGCTSLEMIVLPSSITEISDFSFFGCTSLKKITLPSELEKIGNYAFKDCISLSELVYPKTMLKWGGITKGSEWNTNTGSFVVTCSDGKG